MSTSINYQVTNKEFYALIKYEGQETMSIGYFPTSEFAKVWLQKVRGVNNQWVTIEDGINGTYEIMPLSTTEGYKLKPLNMITEINVYQVEDKFELGYEGAYGLWGGSEGAFNKRESTLINTILPKSVE